MLFIGGDGSRFIPARRARLASLVIALSAPLRASADDPPRIWTWNLPPAGAPVHPFITPAVRMDVTDRSGASAADAVAGQVRSRGLGAGDVCVILQNFGAGDGTSTPETVALAYHRLDALRVPIFDPDQPDEDNRWRTAWMKHGIIESRAWMQSFCDRYASRQLDDPSLPAPARFHFDTELTTAPCCSRLGLFLFDAMRTDPGNNENRFHREPIPGFDGLTLAQLYAENPLPYDLTRPMFEPPVNREFMRWWVPLNFQITDAAMKTAAYDVIHAAWPGTARCSDYIHSARYDGIDGRDYFEATTDRTIGQGWVWSGAADMQALALYAVHPNHRLPGEALWDAALRIHRRNLEHAIGSFGGGHHADMSPWVQLPGQARTRGSGEFVLRHDARRLMALLRGLGIREFQVWSDSPANTAENWTALTRIIRQVWQTRAMAIRSINGENNPPPRPDPAPLTRIDADALAVTSIGGSNNIASVELEFDAAALAGDCRLAFLTVSSVPSGVEAAERLEVWNWSLSRWSIAGDERGDIQSVAAAAALPAPLAWRYVGTPDHVRPGDGRVRARLVHRSAAASTFTSRFDLIQLLGADETLPGDVNHDETVSLPDMSILLSSWGEMVEPRTEGDVDGDGLVDIPDLAIMLNHWNFTVGGNCPR